MSATSTISGDFLHMDARYIQQFSQYRENLHANVGPASYPTETSSLSTLNQGMNVTAYSLETVKTVFKFLFPQGIEYHRLYL